jgi:pyruvate formate lyase activating enzyme
MHIVIDAERCDNCGFCDRFVACPSLIKPMRQRNATYSECIGCGTCIEACPSEAREIVGELKAEEVSIIVDDTREKVQKTTVKSTLESLGYKYTKYPDEEGIFAPCETGGCWNCAMEIDGELRPSCTTAVRDGMVINTEILGTAKLHQSKRIVHGFSGHGVGGVGTPWQMKYMVGYVEAACFACGCNFRCPQCQNWTTTYRGRGEALTPKRAAEIMTATRRNTFVDRMAISGGESTLNRRWLVQYIKELKELNRDEDARFHVDTNGSVLTRDYIDELIEAGMTDVGIDIKGLEIDTFMRITGMHDLEFAERYYKTAWDAVKYIIDNHGGIFIGIGIPYNEELISLDEIRGIGECIFEIDADVQVCVLDYFPAFRNRKISRPSYSEMTEVYRTLRDVGLSTVICQTRYGHIGPKHFSTLAHI